MNDCKRGFQMLDRGNAKRALRHFKKAKEAGLDANVGLILCNDMLNDVKSRDELVESMIKQDDKQDDKPDYYNLKGTFLCRDNKYEDAIKIFEKSLNVKQDPKICMNIGDCFHELHQYEKAIEYYKLADKNGLNDIKHHVSIAQSLRALRRYKESINELDFVIQYEKETNTIAQHMKAEILLECGKHEEALKIFEFLTVQEYNTGVCLAGLQQYKKALEYFDKASDEEFLDYWKAECWFYLGDYEKSIAYCEKAPENYIVLCRWISALGCVGSHEKALELSLRAQKLNSSEINSYMGEYFSLHHLNKTDEAEKCRKLIMEKFNGWDPLKILNEANEAK